MKKIFDLSEADLEVLKEIQRANSDIKTDVAAMRFLIKKYKYDIIEQVEEQREQQNIIQDTVQQMRVTLNIAERNTELALDALNTLLFCTASDKCILKDEIEHTVFSEAEAKIKERIAHNKQKKDFRRSR